MNKAVLIEELDYIGITTLSYEFSGAGYVLELKLNPHTSTGWEQIECMHIPGLEIGKSRDTGAYTRKVLFIPNNSKEFKDYVNKHVKYFGLGKQKALSDLGETVNRYGTKYAKVEVEEYIKRVSKKKI